jgi:hypothetical protein
MAMVFMAIPANNVFAIFNVFFIFLFYFAL